MKKFKNTSSAQLWVLLVFYLLAVLLQTSSVYKDRQFIDDARVHYRIENMKKRLERIEKSVCQAIF